MAIDQMMAFIQSLPPEEQQAAIQQMGQMAQQQPPGGISPGSGMPPAPGMPPQQGQMPPQQGQMPPQQGQMPPQGQDPRMGLPGQNNFPGTEDTFRDFAGEGSIIGDQQAQAEALRQTPSAEGIYTKNAGFIAANPLQHVASALQQGMGNYQAKEALAAKTKLSQDLGSRDKADKEKEYKRTMAEELREKNSRTPWANNPRMSA